MARITRTIELDMVMTDLASRRPVFHSEADFQFAFAQVLAAAVPRIDMRLEARPVRDRAEHVDLACHVGGRRTLIEFKYATAGWVGADPSGEQYAVKNHAAYDLARRYFVHDVRRLERFAAELPRTDGIAIMLTNASGLWSDTGRAHARDAAFRLHEGHALTGHLVWGAGDSPQHDEVLAGAYSAHWSDYSDLGGTRGRFRWLALPVTGEPEDRCPSRPTSDE